MFGGTPTAGRPEPEDAPTTTASIRSLVLALEDRADQLTGQRRVRQKIMLEPMVSRGVQFLGRQKQSPSRAAQPNRRRATQGRIKLSDGAAAVFSGLIEVPAITVPAGRFCIDDAKRGGSGMGGIKPR